MYKRVVAATAAAVVLGGGAYAFAANLTVNTGSLGAGNQTVASCDADGVKATYTTAWDTGSKRYEITGITVKGIAAGCEGDDIKVTLVDSSGVALTEVTGVVGSATDQSFTVAADVLPAPVTGVHVVIDG
jgi:hypothetical protein